MSGSLPWGPSTDGLQPLDGGITEVRGIRAAGIVAGLKDSGAPDLALVDAGAPVTVAVVTTTNQVKAAPCVLTERYAAEGRARAVVVNSGQANACTGPQGFEDARATSAAVAAELGCDPTEVLPLSTGIIGVPIRMERLLPAVPALVADLDEGPAAGERVARAVMTTDTVPKTSAVRFAGPDGDQVVAGFAKGAGMIEPSMATLLSVIATDVQLPPSVLGPLLRRVASRTFNRISIDACGSTNDTVVLLATGASGPPSSTETVESAVEAVSAALTRAVVTDGEGTSKVAAVTVAGTQSDRDAERLARAVTSSALFRAAVHGADPNWGRILAAMGSSEVPFDPDRVEVVCGGVTVCRSGTAIEFDRERAVEALSRAEVSFRIRVGPGSGSATLLTADLTPQYVAENAYYTT